MDQSEALRAVEIARTKFTAAGLCWPLDATGYSSLEEPVTEITPLVLRDLKRAAHSARWESASRANAYTRTLACIAAEYLSDAIALCAPICAAQVEANAVPYGWDRV